MNHGLSHGERRLFRLLSMGLSNTQIAERLCVSRNSVGVYCVRLRESLGFEPGTDLRLVILAMQNQEIRALRSQLARRGWPPERVR